MAKSENQKHKLLLIRDYLEQRSDTEHPVSMAQLLDMLQHNNVQAERKSVYADIDLLRQHGMDILLKPGRGGGYYLASREFELPELKLLVDAVQSSKFLSEAKSRSLIQKLERLCSRQEAQHLNRQVVVSGRVKTMNESIYYNVDRIHEAIGNNSQITFDYTEWNLQKKRVKRPGSYCASPITLVWAEEYYYLVAHTEKHGITHFRVDKMQHINAAGKPRVQNEETRAVDPATYGRKVFGMFGGTLTSIRLRVHNSLAGVMIDRFGTEQMLIPDGPEYFILHFEAAVSPLLLSWLIGFGSQVQILSPNSVRQQCRELCSAFCAQNPPQGTAPECTEA